MNPNDDLKITRSEEDYLKAMLNLTQSGQSITTNTIADKIHVSPPSVNSMVKKLNRKGLVKFQKYGSILFTDLGKKLATSLTRKHRLWEVFLHQKLKFNWDEVHDVAEELEHVKSEKLTQRLDEFLNFPKLDPHGDPIPGNDLKIPLIKNRILTEVATGKNFEFSGVLEDSSRFLKDLDLLGLRLGMKMKVISSKPGFINLKCKNSKEIQIPINLAKKVYVS
jgi:DtxR family Mn-dependent transcriptional regulator